MNKLCKTDDLPEAGRKEVILPNEPIFLKSDGVSFRNAQFLIVIGLFLAGSAHAQTFSYTELASRLTNLQQLAVLPLAGDRAAQWSSYDRASYYDTNSNQYVNWSANGDGSGYIRTEGTQQVLAEMQGPGCIWRIWSATPSSGHVRVYVDSTNTPAVDLAFSGYFDTANVPFNFPTLVHTTPANGWNNYVPIPYTNFCKITADSTWGQYYHFTYETFPSNTVVPSFTRTLGSPELAALTNANQFLQNCGTDPAGTRAGQTTVTNIVSATGGTTQLVAQITGPRAITAIRAKLDVPPAPANYDQLRELAFQINWDGETNASVWSPLGDFFGSAPGTNLFSSLPLGYTSNGWWYCYWYMPFATNAQIRLVNDGTNAPTVTFEITHAPLTQPIEQLGRFHAKWHRDAYPPSDPNRAAIDWTMLKTTGRGRFVGVMLHVWNPKGTWWGEGDEKFFVDGEKFPSVFGTGSEDYFGYAWSSPVVFRHAYHNQPHNDGGSKGHLSVNRWHIGDSVPFQQSFEGSIEKYFSNSRPTLYAATAYWYLAPDGVDPYTSAPVSERVGYWTPIANYRVPGAIEGELMTVLGVSGGGTQSQDMSGFPNSQWSNDAQLWWTGGSVSNTLDLALNVTNAGTYKISARMTKASDYAIVQLFLDGLALGGPIDLYNGSVIATSEIDLGQQLLSVGQHTLRVQILGKNPSAAASYMFGLDYVKIEPPIALVDALNLGNVANDVAAVFSSAVNPATATNVANYAINNGVSILSARMGGTAQSVILQTTGLPAGVPCTLSASNVTDLSANVIFATTLPIEQNLNTWLRLDESSGTTAADSSGQGHHASYQPGATPGFTGKVLRSARLDGVNGHIRLPNGMANFATNGLTIALWARPTVEGSPANWARFADFGNGAANDNILLARNATSSTLTFEVYDGGTSGGKVNSPSGTLVLNQWQHLAVTMDGSGFAVLYKDGVQVGSGSTAVPGIITRTSNLLGLSNWASDGRYAGKMDDVRVYDRVLTGAAVAALAGGGGPDDLDPTLPTVNAVATVPTTATSNAPPGVIAIRRTGNSSGAVTVQYSLSGTAVNGVNYTNLPGSVVFPAGITNANVYITPIDQSFPELSRIATLTVTGNSAYLVDDVNSASVTIQNNSLPPYVVSASADNAVGTVTNSTVDVWFAVPVTSPSVTNLGNYTLVNAPGVSITNAVFGPRQLRTVLRLNKPLPANARISVSGVVDTLGRTASNQIPIALQLSPTNVIANIYHAPATRSTCFSIVSDGVVNNTNNSGNLGFDTWGGSANAPLTQFAGLLYGVPVDLRSIKIDLGKQFGDGGNWMQQPLVYLLKRPLDTGSNRPESDPLNWDQVPAQFVSGGTFQSAADVNPSPTTPLTFDLSALSDLDRACYGWAVGGVRGNGTFGFVSVTEMRGYGAALGAPWLQIQIAGTNAVLTAPFWVESFTLQTTATPEIGASWTTAAGNAQVVGDYYSITVPLSANRAFYRLKR